MRAMHVEAILLAMVMAVGSALQVNQSQRALRRHSSASVLHKASASYAVSAELLQEARDAIRGEAERTYEELMNLCCHYDEIDCEKLAKVFESTYPFSANTFKIFKDDSTIFVGTGDIPQMWLRDSSVQLATYLELAAKSERGSAIRQVLESAMARQRRFILDDPYGSAFFESHGPDNSRGPSKTECPPSPNCPECSCHDCSPACGNYTYQRDFELDSLLFPILLHYNYWKQTGSTSHLDAELLQVFNTSLHVMQIEQSHNSRSNYSYKQFRGSFAQDIGLVWSYALPSDDPAGAYYNVPENIMAAAVLNKAAEMAAGPLKQPELAGQLRSLSHKIDVAIKKYGIVKNKKGQDMYAFNVDGNGAHLKMDDANCPNLLWLPYFDPSRNYSNDRVYKVTRHWVLSTKNPNFVGHGDLWGLGSEHHSFGLTRDGRSCNGQCIWPLGLIMQGLTADGWEEKVTVMNEILNTDAGTGVLHEGFDPEDPDHYNRDGFAWANSLFSQWVGRDWMSQRPCA